jgi:hypothetical protein
MLHEIVAHHPIGETPYNKLIYVGASLHGTPLYRILGLISPHRQQGRHCSPPSSGMAGDAIIVMSH